ncbi:MAG: T9SS type A sorting domain-containing protein [Bacteroidales bacterium]|nr:T9SS type A sorting domain-containing protein [Bacteroidales bacterium]
MNGRIDIGAFEAHIEKISVSGTIGASRDWIADTVEVTGDIYVPDDVTLTISPGTKVMFNGHHRILVHGVLKAVGTAMDSIYFRVIDTLGFSDYESFNGSWNGIEFNNSTLSDGANGAMNDNDSSIFSHCVIKYVKSDNHSGALHIDHFSKILIENSKIIFCVKTGGGGGAIYCRYASPYITNCELSNNFSGYYGAGIYCENSNLYIRNCIISDNEAYIGAGLTFERSSPIVEGCLIKNNIGEANGGTVCSLQSDPLITGCRIINNYHGEYGAAIACIDGSPVLINNLIANNTSKMYAQYRETVYFESTEDALLINNTIANNDLGGICFKSAKVRIYNSIVWGESTSQVKVLDEVNTTIDFYNCVIKGTVSPTYFNNGSINDFINILDSHPGFINPTAFAGYTEDALLADWRLDQFSSCINSGTPDIPDMILPDTDINGLPRINSSFIDIGAYENQGGLPMIIDQPSGGSRCEGEFFSLSVETVDSALYQWQKDAVDIPGEINAYLIIDEVTTSDQGNYRCKISNSYGTVTSNTATLFVNEFPEFLQEPQDMWAEKGKTIALRTYAKGTSPAFQWQKNEINMPGKVTPELNIPSVDYPDEGEYRCIIKNICGSDTTSSSLLYLVPRICMVTFSPASGDNLMVWEKQSIAPLDAYNVYRESSAAGIYDLLGTVGQSALSVFVDTTADPTVQAYLYKITGVDTSGFETDLDLCAPHKTIHLLVSTNPELNTTQLEWDKYYGFNYLTYIIYRSPTGVGYTQIGGIASSLQSWTDPSPLADVGYYRIGVEKALPCVPTGGGKKADSGPYSHALSNTEDNRLQETGENQEPTDILLSKANVDENKSIGSFVGRMETIDPDTTDHHVYKLAAGPGDDDNQRFTTLGDLLVTAEELDYETRDTCYVRIKTIDKGDLFFEQEFIILVNDVDESVPNEPPVDITISSQSIAENKSTGSLVGKLWTDDPDVFDDHTYAFVSGPGDDDNGRFMILDDLLLSDEQFDFETEDTMYIRIKSTDKGDLPVEKAFMIFITDVNEESGNLAPTNITLSSNTIDENRLSGILIGVFSTTDPDMGDVHAYTLVEGLGGDDNDGLMIMGNILISGAEFDYETNDTLFIRVETTDQGGLSFEKTFILLVNDVFEAAPNLSPTDIMLSTIEIDENRPALTLIGRFQTNDPNMEDLHTYLMIEGEGDDNNNSFILVGDALFSAYMFDYEAKDEYNIRIRTMDNGEGSLTTEKTFTIVVNDLLELDINEVDDGTGRMAINPNPFTENTTIKFSNPDQARFRLSVTDLTGKVVYLKDNIYTDLIEFKRNELPAGMYFVEMKGDEIYRGRMIIE